MAQDFMAQDFMAQDAKQWDVLVSSGEIKID